MSIELFPANGDGSEEQVLTCCLVILIGIAGLLGIGIYRLIVWLF